MSPDADRSPLVAEILAGKNRDLTLLAAQGLMPLPQDELIGLQVALADSEDAEVATTARDSLGSLDPQVVVAFLQHEEKVEVLTHFARTARHPSVLETILTKRKVTPQLLAEIAPTLSPQLQEVLLQRQDAIVEHAAILDQLETNPDLSSFSKRRIHEYREHLLPKERRTPVRREVEVLEGVADALTEEGLEEMIVEAATQPAEGELDETTGLTESQIKALPAPARLKLSRGASKSLRNILIRDSNPLVAVSVLKNSPFSEGEIERISANRTVIDDVLETIARKREWIRKYNIVANLTRNPRCPVGLAVRLLPRLSVRDLRGLTRDKNVANAVRSTARRLYTMKIG